LPLKLRLCKFIQLVGILKTVLFQSISFLNLPFQFRMMPVDFTKLDNPAWYALTERHSHFAMGTATFKKYNPGIVLFAGFDKKNENAFSQLDEVIAVNESVFLFDKFPALPPNYTTEAIVECLQMICTTPVPATGTEEIILLNESNTDEMFALVSEVFPGYYLPGTNCMGDYFGIFKAGKLVAMAGERLCMDGFTEVSAVVTHPDFTGRKYAQQLMTHLHQKHLNEGVTSFLHTGSGNERARKIYELLGYEKRRLIPVTKIKRIT
jgi:GNAT superfamily N-acetyltransferase